MGSLVLPAGGRVCIDTQIVIYTVDKHPTYFPVLRPLWEAAADQQFEIVTCGLTEMEALISPVRHGRDDERKRIETLLDQSCRLLPVSRSVLLRAADLRAAHLPLKTPDALHLAASDWSSCAMFLTNDKRLKTAATRVPVVILDEVIAP